MGGRPARRYKLVKVSLYPPKTHKLETGALRPKKAALTEGVVAQRLVWKSISARGAHLFEAFFACCLACSETSSLWRVAFKPAATRAGSLLLDSVDISFDGVPLNPA